VQGELAAQSDNAVSARWKVLCFQFRLHAKRTIRLATLHMNGLDGDLQARIVLGALRQLPLPNWPACLVNRQAQCGVFQRKTLRQNQLYCLFPKFGGVCL